MKTHNIGSKIFNILLIIIVLLLFKHIATSDSDKDILRELNNESIKSNQMYGLESIEESYSSNLKYYPVQLRCTTTYLNGPITFNKGDFRVLTIRDRNTNKLLAVYVPVGELETRERVLLTNVKSIKITDDVVSNITGAPSKVTEKIEVPVEKYFNINEVVKAYNGKYSNTVLAFEKINKSEYDKFVDSHISKNYNKIFAILIDYVNPIAGAILIVSVVYVLYRLLQERWGSSMNKKLSKVIAICLLTTSIFAMFSFRVLFPILKGAQLERYANSNIGEKYEDWRDTGPLTQITKQIADRKSFGTIFITPNKMEKLSEGSEYTKDIKVIKNKDKRVLITLRDSKTNKLLSAYNIVTTNSSLVYTFGEQDKQISILEPENSKLDINIIRVKGSHGFVDFKDFLILSQVDKITYSELDLDSDSPKYKEYSFTLGDLPEIKNLISEYNSKYSKNKLSLEYLDESTYNKIIGDQITTDKGYPKEVPVYMIIVVFIVVFTYILFAILYVIQMKA